MVPNEILQSVCFIKTTGTGSCFIISIEKEAHIITDRHLFQNPVNGSKISFELMNDNKWVQNDATLLLHTNANIDIAVLKMNIKRNDDFFDIGSSKKSWVSQDCYFLGFPYGMRVDDNNDISKKINGGFPLPFVKKGIISSMLTDSNDVRIVYLDGHNNPGFSGGPVVIQNIGKSNRRMRIISVISGYINQRGQIKSPFGNFDSYENSGIVISHSIDHIFEIIAQNS